MSFSLDVLMDARTVYGSGFSADRSFILLVDARGLTNGGRNTFPPGKIRRGLGPQFLHREY
jgi:hypothetical protein